MTAALVLLALLQATAAPAPVRGTVLDAASGAPVVGATVRSGAAAALTDALGGFSLAAGEGDTVWVRRVGYRAAVTVADGRAKLDVRLSPVALPLSEVGIVERADAAAGRLDAAVTASELRAAGVRTAAAAAARLPFVSSRGTHGDVRLSMRGSRAEQVLVTLDGVPLNDPALGAADLADVPLAAIGGIAVLPGADPIAGGSGATGGTVAITSGEGTALSASGGSLGRYELEGASRLPFAGGGLRLGAAAGGARNDFQFVNTAGSSLTPDTAERRVNNDERRRSVFASGVFPRLQLTALATVVERGLVGGMNVRSYDRDRGRTTRALLRLATDAGRTSLSAAVRGLGVRYRDPLHPESDADARTISADAEAARAVSRIVLRAGGGADRLRGEGSAPLSAATRGRGFASASGAVRRGAARASAGVRLDAIERSGVRPSGTVAGELGQKRVLFARASQAFRAPSLYDLYFAAPQRLQPANVRPERVVLDAEVGARLRWAHGSASGSLFERRTRDAIIWFPGNFVFSPANVPRERASGGEARAELRGARWDAAAWGGVYRTRLDVVGGPLPTPYAPNAAGGGSATLRAFGRRAFRSAPAARRNELPGVALLDAAASWERSAGRAGRVRITAGVENLGDVRWESIRSYPSAGRVWTAGVTLESR